jgi:signal recognition particle subunit SRP19
MKDYKRLVLWLDYFNSALSRREGRRIPRDRCVKDPRLDELAEAARRLGLSPEPAEARRPIRMMTKSGYVSVEKTKESKKDDLLDVVAKNLSAVRGERSSSAEASTSSKKRK